MCLPSDAVQRGLLTLLPICFPRQFLNTQRYLQSPQIFLWQNDVSTKSWFSIEKDDTVVYIASGTRIAFEKTCGNSRNKNSKAQSA